MAIKCVDLGFGIRRKWGIEKPICFLRKNNDELNVVQDSHVHSVGRKSSC